ncbi:unnamed protein product [Adineta steineri]|uniref:Uncharacterized protein n=1 Tax=Adineta steineri TaxID=433720 RepID=A0A819PVK5_9BILA|nr:unnamed protein product [Adineta steineri]
MKVWPILSGECMKVQDERIKMETLCSFLFGKDGNSGYYFIGLVENRADEERRVTRKFLNKYMDEPVVDENGLPTTKRLVASGKNHKTLSAKSIDSDSVARSGYDPATRYRNGSPEAMAAINDFVQRMKLAEKSGSIGPELVDTTFWKIIQYGWSAPCPQRKCVYCGTGINTTKPDCLLPARYCNVKKHDNK